MRLTLSIEEILRMVGEAQVAGNYDRGIQGIASLEVAVKGDLSFLGNYKYRRLVPDSRASILLLPHQYEGSPQPGQMYLRVKDPSHALGLICASIETRLHPPPPIGVHETAFIHAEARVSKTARIGAFAFVGEGTSIGDEAVLGEHACVGRQVTVGNACHLRPRVVVGDYCELGCRVILQPGVIIGSDGYGYDFLDEAHHKIPHVGKVVIEDDVEIGANSTIDRARFSETRIGKGTKIDNLVQIAHNVTIGKHCLIIAQVGISGSTVIEDGAIIGGQAGLGGHLHIGAGAKIAAQSAITSDVEPGAYLKGSPALPYML
ncbi:MAG: UDP-3-O-(3-hydroxymyristoyl)glucosamine N-acyltransferase, partial [Opitutales bacterium]